MTRLDSFNAIIAKTENAPAHATHGVLLSATLAVKDIYDVAGMKTGCGNPQILAESPVATRSAPTVEKLLAAGAAFIGKTQTDELAFSLMGQNSHYPYPINPSAPDRVTGGSSSGSAAAVAGGLADIALGSDTGGSIRAPASFCGLVGLRTTHGRIPLEGIMPLAPSLDTIGWFARDIDLYEKVGQILLGEDKQAFAFSQLLYMPLLEHLLLDHPETDSYRAMFAKVRPHFANLKAASQPTLSIDELYLTFRQIQGAEAWATHGAWISSGDRKLGPGVADRFAYGSKITEEALAQHRSRRTRFTQELETIIGDNAVLALPTVPGAAPFAKEPFETLQAYREQALRLLCLSVLSGLPQITVPLGTVHGVPMGISFIGPRGSDRALVTLAQKILIQTQG
ncbi:amidase [Brucella pituitosa]|uniref:amidase n=1 Tax=Brucella TaxID=234 RepID=UPI000463CB24|nr:MULTISPECIES: amidase [Brucella]PQZ48080.1 amidase [Ochrobactrum sp. MYb19]PRA54344.1 amidase [Ochrobactrum sp. MYb68]PRA64265.1 amidase [Ochrobactrum sp. MYb18]PRA75226.1 amidase [Brucella thiophenivorans]PRA83986.1 amidase [Ochrobactrum sp. MYb29]PRA89564.1 amidase [Ochrobactrum sp. MYb14]PRA96593.1 amidase [Ochrobactrum sp. MYb15]